MTDLPAFEKPDRPTDASYCRIAMAQASRLFQPSIAGVSSVQQLLSTPASWGGCDAPRVANRRMRTRLQSYRRRGVAPAHPDGDDLADLREGTLIVFPGGFVLEPEDRRRPCINVARSTIGEARFYRDAFDVTLTSGMRIVVRTSAVEQVDSIFQAYFWSPMG